LVLRANVPAGQSFMLDICSREPSQDVRQIVEWLEQKSLAELL
jgi:hypothetical protein